MTDVMKQNAREVLNGLYGLLDKDDELWASFCDMLTTHAEKNAHFREALDAWLDEQLSNDVFGSEGQLDPRGDHRDEEEDES